MVLYFLYSCYFRYNWNLLISILSKILHPIIFLLQGYFYVNLSFVAIASLKQICPAPHWPKISSCKVHLWVVNSKQSSRCYLTCFLCHLLWKEILMTNKHKKSKSNFNYIGLSNISVCDGRTLCLQQRAVILPHMLSLFYNFV